MGVAVLCLALIGAWRIGRLPEHQTGHTERVAALDGRESSRALADIDVVEALAEIQATLKAEMHGPR